MNVKYFLLRIVFGIYNYFLKIIISNLKQTRTQMIGIQYKEILEAYNYEYFIGLI